MGRPGFEPATPDLSDQCANHYTIQTELLRKVKFLKYKVLRPIAERCQLCFHWLQIQRGVTVTEDPF